MPWTVAASINDGVPPPDAVQDAALGQGADAVDLGLERGQPAPLVHPRRDMAVEVAVGAFRLAERPVQIEARSRRGANPRRSGPPSGEQRRDQPGKGVGAVGERFFSTRSISPKVWAWPSGRKIGSKPWPPPCNRADQAAELPSKTRSWPSGAARTSVPPRCARRVRGRGSPPARTRHAPSGRKSRPFDVVAQSAVKTPARREASTARPESSASATRPGLSPPHGP